MSTTKIKALKPPKSVFNLSYEKKFDFDMGQLIPICCEEMVPGDYFKIGNEIVIRFQPMFAPVLQEINAYVHYFFVPTRLLWEYWEDFITGGEDGLDNHVLPRFSPGNASSAADSNLMCGKYSPYDYFGFPLLSDGSWARFPGDVNSIGGAATPSDPEYYFRPLAFPWRAMNLVWNEFYRDENLQDEVSLDSPYMLYRNWHKDYFTSALEAQQRGIAPAVSMRGYLPIHVADTATDIAEYQSYVNSQGTDADEPVLVNMSDSPISKQLHVVPMVADLGDGAGIDVSELRTAFQIQKWMERNMRAGVRYTSFLHAHYSVSPRDDRLQRPEYLGGSKSPIIVSEVLQTSQASGQSTPTGAMYGRGITADKNFCCSYHAKEFGYLIGFLSVMPKATYQQGVDRQWLRKSRFDFFSPEFSHLSEQELSTEEIFAFPGGANNGDESNPIGNDYIFGYQARYNEMRANKSKVCGSLRDTLDYWHLGRQFDTVPQLNSDFITCDPTRDDLKRIFQVENVPGMICNFANIITAVRPLPKFGEPGLIDHD